MKVSVQAPLASSITSLLQEFSRYFVCREKASTLRLRDRKDKVYALCETTSRGLAWFVGKTAFGFIVTRKQAKNTEQDRQRRLLLQSKLMSGSLAPRFFGLFGRETLGVLRLIDGITEDKTVSE